MSMPGTILNSVVVSVSPIFTLPTENTLFTGPAVSVSHATVPKTPRARANAPATAAAAHLLLVIVAFMSLFLSFRFFSCLFHAGHARPGSLGQPLSSHAF